MKTWVGAVLKKGIILSLEVTRKSVSLLKKNIHTISDSQNEGFVGESIDPDGFRL